MPITFNCACGKLLRVSDEHAGRRVKCPACAAVATVPAPEPMFEVVEDVSQPLAPPPPPKGRPVAKPSVARDDDEDDDRGYGVAKKRRDDDEEEEEKPRKKKKKPKWKEKSADRERDSGGGSSAGAEIGGGLISMLIGGIICGLVWTNRGAISPLGIILLIAGLIGVVKGLAGGSGE